MALLSCEYLTMSYDGNTVLSELSFEVNAGDYLCIVGENGSGKSTLIKAVLSLKNPCGGNIKFGDGLKPNEIGYLPQNTNVQKDFPASVWEIVLSGCQNRRGLKPFYSKQDRETAIFSMDSLGITNLKKKSYRELSGGQQRRVFLARAFCAAKKLIVLDEPSAGLDPVVTGEFYRLIKKRNDEGLTVITVSHDIASVVKDASLVLHLKNKPAFFGKTADYLNSDAGKRFVGGEEND